MGNSAESKPEEKPAHRYAEGFSTEELEQLRRSRVVDAEAYMRWLETGEGADPWDESSD